MAQVVFFVYLWPEPLSSAAGIRTVELTRILQTLGHEVIGISPAKVESKRQEWPGVKLVHLDPNTSDLEFALKNWQPKWVFYDRFYIEEQFSESAMAAWPNAAHILDTIDLHSIRRGREDNKHLPYDQMTTSVKEDDSLRELASIFRADATLVVSTWEKSWLIEQGIPENRVFHLPFSANPQQNVPCFEERSGLCFIGNFRHSPNLDAFRWLTETLWPKLQPIWSELHIYGAYPPQEVSQYSGKNGIRCHGPVDDHRTRIEKHLASIAPLRFGAGIKGKVLESWACGTPVLGTSVAFEGLAPYPTFSTLDQLLAMSECLKRPDLWKVQQELGTKIIRENFLSDIVQEKFKEILDQSSAEFLKWRQSIIGRVLRHHHSQSSRYFRRWIAAKNKLP